MSRGVTAYSLPVSVTSLFALFEAGRRAGGRALSLSYSARRIRWRTKCALALKSNDS